MTKYDIAVVMIFYNPNWKITRRIVSHVTKTMTRSKLNVGIIAVDNSPEIHPYMRGLESFANTHYIHNEGYNLYIAGGMNKAMELDNFEVLAHVCTNHGRMYDQRWIDVIYEGVQEDGVGMAGCIQPCDFYPVAQSHGRTPPAPHLHIQGGCCAYDVEALKEVGAFSYRFPSEFLDVHLSMQMIEAGYKLKHTPEIMGVSAGIIQDPHMYYWVHDYNGIADNVPHIGF